MTMDSEHKNPTRHLKGQYRAPLWMPIALGVLVVAVVLALTMVTPYAYFEDRHQGQVIKSVQPAGAVITVTLQAGLWSRSLVETELGFYALTEGVSLARHEALTLELRTNGDRYLCDGKHCCTQLL